MFLFLRGLSLVVSLLLRVECNYIFYMILINWGSKKHFKSSSGVLKDRTPDEKTRSSKLIFFHEAHEDRQKKDRTKWHWHY
jgi:hypothetical protein